MKKLVKSKVHPLTAFRQFDEKKQADFKKSLPKAQLGSIVKTVAKYAKPVVNAAKSAMGYAKPTVKKVADTYKKAKATSYANKTSHLKRSEDWDKFHAAQNDKKLATGMTVIGGGATGAALYKKSKKK